MKEIRQALRPEWVAYTLTRLSDVAAGTTGTIAEVRANRPADRVDLSARGLLEGTRITVRESADGDALAIAVGAGIVLLPRELAEQLMIARPTAASVVVAR